MSVPLGRSSAVALALAAASGASAQGIMTISWTVGDTGNNDGIIVPGESGLAILWAHMDPMAVGFAGTIYDVVLGGQFGRGTYSFDNYLDELTNDGTDLGGGLIAGVESFQLPPAFNPHFHDPNPLAIGALTWTPSDFNWDIVTFATANHLNFDVYTDDFGTSASYEGVVRGGQWVIPTAPTLALFGLGAFRARRRR
ncbi:MAG TPA: hypothetical protein VFF69_06260 [Phycisphaerales bacterium]|nr:hypothetical protein [Phycisphaerales bacterium]